MVQCKYPVREEKEKKKEQRMVRINKKHIQLKHIQLLGRTLKRKESAKTRTYVIASPITAANAPIAVREILSFRMYLATIK